MKKTSTQRFALAFATVSILGCGASQTPPPATASTTTTTSGTMFATPETHEVARGDESPLVATSPSALNDEQTLAAIRAAGRSVLEQSRQAVKKGRSTTVRELAHELLDTYGQVAARLDAVANESGLTLVEGPASEEMKRRGEDLTLRLAGSAGGGASFDRAYVEGQLEEAANLVALIDRAETQTRNVELQTFLREIRTRVVDARRAAAGVQVEIAR
jgi:predicted outer membrane protein